MQKYGSDQVARIITFGTRAARAAVRDVGRALALGYQNVDTVAKLIPNELGMTIDKALSAVPALKKSYESDENVRRLIDVSRALEGMPRHASTHAAGVVITREPADTYVPLQKNDEAIVTQDVYKRQAIRSPRRCTSTLPPLMRLATVSYTHLPPPDAESPSLPAFPILHRLQSQPY